MLIKIMMYYPLNSYFIVKEFYLGGIHGKFMGKE
jgi:hypothetical protein